MYVALSVTYKDHIFFYVHTGPSTTIVIVFHSICNVRAQPIMACPSTTAANHGLPFSFSCQSQPISLLQAPIKAFFCFPRLIALEVNGREYKRRTAIGRSAPEVAVFEVSTGWLGECIPV